MKLRVALTWLGSYYKGQTFSVLGVGKFFDDAKPYFVALKKRLMFELANDASFVPIFYIEHGQ